MTPKLSRDIEDGLRGTDGWQPKSPRNSIWQGNPACWGLPESNRGCPGPSDIMRETVGTLKRELSMSNRAKVQAQTMVRPRWGNGRSRAQWNSLTTSVTFAGHKARTAEVTICIISKRLLDRPRQSPSASWIFQLGDSYIGGLTGTAPGLDESLCMLPDSAIHVAF